VPDTATSGSSGTTLATVFGLIALLAISGLVYLRAADTRRRLG
jgi:hypothetical protein